jgi:hypothetical protein
MKNFESIFFKLIPFGFVAAVAGLYAAYFANQDRCPDLTVAFMWELVPVSAYIFMFPLSAAVWDISLKEKGESALSFYGVVMWAALVHGCFLLPLAFMVFPAERFFNTGATCSYVGETYFASVVTPFVLAQSFVWIVSLAGAAWIHSLRPKKF